MWILKQSWLHHLHMLRSRYFHKYDDMSVTCLRHICLNITYLDLEQQKRSLQQTEHFRLFFSLISVKKRQILIVYIFASHLNITQTFILTSQRCIKIYKRTMQSWGDGDVWRKAGHCPTLSAGSYRGMYDCLMQFLSFLLHNWRQKRNVSFCEQQHIFLR